MILNECCTVHKLRRGAAKIRELQCRSGVVREWAGEWGPPSGSMQVGAKKQRTQNCGPIGSIFSSQELF